MFDHFLRGKRVTLITDNEPVQLIFSNKRRVPVMAAERIQRWAVYLGAHQNDIFREVRTFKAMLMDYQDFHFLTRKMK